MLVIALSENHTSLVASMLATWVTFIEPSLLFRVSGSADHWIFVTILLLQKRDIVDFFQIKVIEFSF